MDKNRKKYTSEFKEDAVKLITEQGYKITKAAPESWGQCNHVGAL